MATRRRTRGRQQLWATSIGEPVGDATPPTPWPRFTKLVELWLPRRFRTARGVDAMAFVDEVNQLIAGRGMVLEGGQILTTPIVGETRRGVIKPRMRRVAGQSWPRPIHLGRGLEILLEPRDFEATHPVEPARVWGAEQAAYFGLSNPYQMAEEPNEYTDARLLGYIAAPYLWPDERIAALVHGLQDDHYFNCPCHCAEVVYTTRRRLVCMGCGAMHLALDAPIAVGSAPTMSADDWLEYFRDEGARVDDELDLNVIDVREIEAARPIWITAQWEEAIRTFALFARSSPEVIAQAIRGTERDPSILLEAGFMPVETAPPPAHQIANDSIEVDLTENGAHALSEGVGHFLGARRTSSRLVNAVPQLFRACELWLKARLRQLAPTALDDHPNNPTVLARLAAHGVAIQPDELDAITRLRRLRNRLQHGEASFNHRAGLSICRAAVVFLDRFSNAELGLWIGDLVSVGEWQKLLALQSIAQTADRVVAERLTAVRADTNASVEWCSQCTRLALVRPHRRTGASCLYCGAVPSPRTKSRTKPRRRRP